MSNNGSPASQRPVTLQALLLVALVSAVVGVYWQMGIVRAEPATGSARCSQDRRPDEAPAWRWDDP